MFKILVRVKPNAKENRIKKVAENQFLIWVKARPRQGQANQAVIEVLSNYFAVSKSYISLLKGQASKHKIFVIKEPEK